jgi:peptide/nickel transport system substrate-binding protein
LEANPNYWNTARGARLERVIFLNDVSQKEAIERVCFQTGEVDIVTNVSPTDAGRIQNSPHAKLVSANAMRVVAGIFNRNSDLLDDVRMRKALNHAIDRERLVENGLNGYGEPSAGLTPRWTTTPLLSRLSPYKHDAERAKQLFEEAGWQTGRRLKLATGDDRENLARMAAMDISNALEIDVDVTVYSDAEKLRELRNLAERKIAPDWDVFVYGWSGQTTDAPPLELHYHFVGANGALKSGETIPEFERIYDEFTEQTSVLMQAKMAYDIDKFVYDEALALFMCSPQALYAVNREVDFTPYATTFELAECEVSANHWSHREPDAA